LDARRRRGRNPAVVDRRVGRAVDRLFVNPKSQIPKPKSQTRAAETQRPREEIYFSVSLSLCGPWIWVLGFGSWDLGFEIYPGVRTCSGRNPMPTRRAGILRSSGYRLRRRTARGTFAGPFACNVRT